MIVTQGEREREAETQAKGEIGSMHQEPDVGFDPRSPGSHPGPKADTKPLHHPGIPKLRFSKSKETLWELSHMMMKKKLKNDWSTRRRKKGQRLYLEK